MSSSRNSSLPSALLESLRSIGYTLETALADIIDNSITAEASSVSVRFLWNNGNPWIAVCDDGFGMSDKELTDAMRLSLQMQCGSALEVPVQKGIRTTWDDLGSA
jgi:hypothetical protein